MNSLQALQDFIQTMGEDALKGLLYTEEQQQNLIEDLKKLDPDEPTYDKGVSFETWVGGLFSPFAELRERTRTGTNELDIVAHWNPGTLALLQHFYPDLFKLMGNKMLLECKNYPRKKVDVTWVGKFASVLLVHEFDVGVIFSRKGLTGANSWRDATGFVRKYALKKSTYILNAHDNEFNGIISNGLFTFLDNDLSNVRNQIALPTSDSEVGQEVKGVVS